MEPIRALESSTVGGRNADEESVKRRGKSVDDLRPLHCTLIRYSLLERRDLKFVLGGESVEVDVQRDRVENLAGGGAEFSSGAEGIGSGSAGGFATYFDLDSFGDGPNNATSNIGAEYRKVDTPGGL